MYRIEVGRYAFEGRTKKEAEAKRDEYLAEIFDGQNLQPVVVPYTTTDGESHIAVLWRSHETWTYTLYGDCNDGNGSCCMLNERSKRQAEFRMRRHLAQICDSWDYLHPQDKEGRKSHQEHLDWNAKCQELIRQGCPEQWVIEVAQGRKSLDEVRIKPEIFDNLKPSTPTPIAQPTEASEPVPAPTPAEDLATGTELVAIGKIKLTDAQVKAIRTLADDPTAKVGRAKASLVEKGLVDADGSLTRKGRSWLHARANTITTARKSEIEVGGYYLKIVSGVKTIIRITASKDKGWEAFNLRTGRNIHVKAATGLTVIPSAKLGEYKQMYATHAA